MPEAVPLYVRKNIARKYVLAMTRPLRASPPGPGVASVSAAALAGPGAGASSAAPPHAPPPGGASSSAGAPPSGAVGASAEAPLGSAFWAIRRRELRAAIPDKGKHTAPIACEEIWGDLEDAFGMHPLMKPCWTCFL